MKNNKKYWFAQKKYGYGLVPISVEGWLMTLLLIVLIIASGYSNNFFTEEPNWREVIGFLLDLFVLTSVFLLLCTKRMEGELEWRWGKSKP